MLVLPGKNSAGDELDIANFESSEGDKNEDLDSNSFGDEEIRNND